MLKNEHQVFKCLKLITLAGYNQGHECLAHGRRFFFISAVLHHHQLCCRFRDLTSIHIGEIASNHMAELPTMSLKSSNWLHCWVITMAMNETWQMPFLRMPHVIGSCEVLSHIEYVCHSKESSSWGVWNFGWFERLCRNVLKVPVPVCILWVKITIWKFGVKVGLKSKKLKLVSK